MGKTAIVAGATGLVGGELVRILAGDRTYERVLVLVRGSMNWGLNKVQQRIVNYDRLEDALAAEDLEGADVYCALGTTIKKAGSQEAFRKVDYEYPMALGRLAAKTGAAQLLIVSAMGASPKSGVFYSRVKGELEEGLKALGVKGLHIFQPSLLLGDREEFRFGERVGAVMSPLLRFVLAGGLRKYRPIEARHVAGSMVKIAAQHRQGVHLYESDQIERIATSG